jgi:hypothetical protein
MVITLPKLHHTFPTAAKGPNSHHQCTYVLTAPRTLRHSTFGTRHSTLLKVPAEQVKILQDVIRNVHGCESRHIESVHVCQSLEGCPVWEGDVEIFELSPPLAGRKCFAWAYLEDRPRKQRRYVTVLEEAPAVLSAHDAVRASLVSDARAWPN